MKETVHEVTVREGEVTVPDEGLCWRRLQNVTIAVVEECLPQKAAA